MRTTYAKPWALTLAILLLLAGWQTFAADIAVPANLFSCETAGCNAQSPQYGQWTFMGTKGQATWSRLRVTAQLTVERYDADQVVIRRVDNIGPTQGLTAVYKGKINGSRIEGTSQYSWPGHPLDGQSFPWFATLDAQGAGASTTNSCSACAAAADANLRQCLNVANTPATRVNCQKTQKLELQNCRAVCAPASHP